MQLSFEKAIVEAAPALEVVLLEADVVNSPTGDALWTEMERAAALVREKYQLPEIKERPAIAATRAAYKALGKEPNRYRPSAEALCRRLVKGMELYRTTALVDIINIVSVATGYSIGGFDADAISGDMLCLGVGREGEPFEAIGRGPLNIARLPVWRDAAGGIGTPTSDNERTKLSESTRRLLCTVNIYGREVAPEETARLLAGLLERHCRAERVEWRLVKCSDSA